MKNNNTIISLAAIFFSCFVIAQQGNATSITGAVHLSSSVRLGRVTAGRNSRLRVASAKLQSSRIGSTLTMNSRVRMGGPVTLDRNIRVNVGALTMNNGYIGGTATMNSNVRVQDRINGEAGGEIGLGGMQITADDNYNPSNNRFLPPGSSLQPISGLDAFTGKDSLSEVERYLLFAHMSQDVYGKSPARLKGWSKVYDSNTDKSPASRVMKLFGGHAVTYRNPNTNELVTVFEGTRNPAEIKSHPVDLLEDIAEDFLQQLGPTPQYRLGEMILEDVYNTWGKNNSGAKMVVSGHSLGGGIAQYAGAKLAMKHPDAKIEGVVFNPADLGLAADIQLMANRKKLNNISMTEIRINGDPVSATQVVRMGTVFPRCTVYDLPTNETGFTNHGIATIIEKIKENKNTFASYKVPDTLGNVALNKFYHLN